MGIEGAARVELTCPNGHTRTFDAIGWFKSPPASPLVCDDCPWHSEGYPQAWHVPVEYL